MKRCFLFGILLCLILNLCGCGFVGLDGSYKFIFYYLADPIDYKTTSCALASELRNCSAYRDDELALINYYFEGPETDKCRSPFPSEVRATKIIVTSDTVNIHLNDRFADIKGLDFTIACACLSKTLMEVFQRDNVKLFATRNFSDGSAYVEISKDSLLLWDAV